VRAPRYLEEQAERAPLLSVSSGARAADQRGRKPVWLFMLSQLEWPSSLVQAVVDLRILSLCVADRAQLMSPSKGETRIELVGLAWARLPDPGYSVFTLFI
jgi:hypothetical protein